MSDKKLPSTFANMVIVLTLVSVVSALALAFTYSKTKDAIAQVGVKKTLKALQQVLPEFNNDPIGEKYILAGEEFKDIELYPAKKDGQLIGTAVQTFSNNGYGGRIILIVGFDNENKISGISVVQQTETPGLGNKMNDLSFKNLDTNISHLISQKKLHVLHQVDSLTHAVNVQVSAFKYLVTRFSRQPLGLYVRISTNRKD
ncbi:MAG: RnfABCDGE type electron transport complex subunit G, partial [Acidobacteria bacterium]|nr:RnfABCDGE type electron transport complex subunit G [Acidobacteriota bacterium]